MQRAEEVMRRSKYSKLLQNLIRIMLSSCLDRPLPSQIYSAFKPYEKEILMLEPFRFDISKMYGSLHNSDASFGSIR